jgi:N-methylhydantoinase B
VSITTPNAPSPLADLPPQREPGFWDGVAHSYIPPKDLRIDGSLKLHQADPVEVDPVSYEVIRYSLLNINLEHNALIQKLAASQVIIISRDYQTAIMTERGEMLFVGPGVQYFANSASLSVQYTLENRSASPGIKPGDMFLSNDVFVGAPHQPDTCIAAPVFVGDELFCWTSNTLHYLDVGGAAAGSFCMEAEDAWDEGQNWPPIKLVEDGDLRTDVEQLFLRQSRFPALVGMDVRAAIAANEYTRRKILELVERYGADVVKTVMNRTLDAGEQLFVERLKSVPDGTWSHRAYAEGKVPGDRELYTYQTNVTKLGDRLYVDNRGTDPQAGSINISFAACAGGTLAAIMGQLVPDLAGAYGGPYRRVEFRLEPGLLNCADFPAACSPSGAATTETQINDTCIAVSKMLSCGGEESEGRILGTVYPHAACLVYGGVDPEGQDFIAMSGEIMFDSFGAGPNKDGYDFGGSWWIPSGIAANVEDMESRFPCLYLYRRALPGGLDGAGRRRGGSGYEVAITLREGASGAAVWTMNEAWPRGSGIWGAPLPSRSRQIVIRDTDLLERLGKGEVPGFAEELSGERESPSWFTMNVPFGHGDVFEWRFPTKGGYGDPLRRDPEDVLADLDRRMLDEATAKRVYGVVIRDERVDPEATAALRLDLRRERLGGEQPGEPVAAPEGARRVGELLHLVDGRWWCNGADLGPAEENYKNAVRVVECKTYELGPEFDTDDVEIADRAVYRQFICPVTGYMIDCETSLVGQQPLHDVRLYS